MTLPESKNLPINLLSACFNNTVATYKYYWLLSIIQEVESGKMNISKRNLFARMISNAWYTLNYFHVSFGKLDIIQNAINAIKEIENIPIDERQELVYENLSSSTNFKIKRQLWHFNKNVPHWFLTPWFPKIDNETDSQQKRRIYLESKSFKNNCLYALHDDFILVNPEWKNYLLDCTRIIKDFCYWNLALFLQAKNPNVPDIPNKLIKPAQRGSLIKQRKEFWDVIFNRIGVVECIYTKEKLTLGNYAVEHFIPYNFVSHDLIWNLIPADISFNSTKSDKLPPLEVYFDPFFELQKEAISIVQSESPKNKFLQDYLTIFPDLKSGFSKEKFKEIIQPLITIASNNGFEFLK